MTTVGVVGLGLLGSAVAARLRAGGHVVVGYDVVAEKVQALVAVGGRAAPTAEAVAEAAEAGCVVLPSLASVDEGVLGSRGLAASGPPGRTIIQMSTISPALTQRLAREVTAKGLAFLDAPISGTSAMVARGEGIVLVGGERGVFDRWRPLLETILPSAVFIGRAGQAMLLKLVANLLVALHSAAAAEALLMARAAGLDLGLVLDVLCRSAASSRISRSSPRWSGACRMLSTKASRREISGGGPVPQSACGGTNRRSSSEGPSVASAALISRESCCTAAMRATASAPETANSAARSRSTSRPHPNPSAYTRVLPSTWPATAARLFDASVAGRHVSCAAVRPSRAAQTWSRTQPSSRA